MNHQPLPWKVEGCSVSAANGSWVFRFGIGILSPDVELTVKAVNAYQEMQALIRDAHGVLAFFLEETKPTGAVESRTKELMARLLAAGGSAGSSVMTHGSKLKEPIPMILHCPWCGFKHVDKDEWVEKTHRTHLCESCTKTWKPCNWQTIGVETL